MKKFKSLSLKTTTSAHTACTPHVTCACCAALTDKHMQDENRHDHCTENRTKCLFMAAGIYVIYILSTYFLHYENRINYLFLFLAYILSGYKVIKSACKNIIKGRILDENFLMSVATFGAIAIGEYPEAVGVMLFYGIGEYLQTKAVGKSRKSIAKLIDIKPLTANLIINKQIKKVDPHHVKIGDIILVKVGEKVPLDGKVIKGCSDFDTSPVTGESQWRAITEGEKISSGIINKTAAIEIEVTQTFTNSTVSKILEIVENAGKNKSPTENFITTFSRYYTPPVVIMAILLAGVPPLIFNEAFSKWLYRGLIFLVVSCPCALVLSIPLSYFSGIGISSKYGILVKGSNYLEALRNVRTLVFDKTGTLTEAIFKVNSISLASGVKQDDFLKALSIAETGSTHPIARSIIDYIKEDSHHKAADYSYDLNLIQNWREIPAKGIEAVYEDQKILVGNAQLLTENHITFCKTENYSNNTNVYVALNGKYLGLLELSDQIKKDAYTAIQNLHSIAVRTVILSGDGEATVQKVAQNLGISEFFGSLLPQQKVEHLEKIIAESSKHKVAFVGDGINDAPVIARADIGISMGTIGSDAAIEASDVVIMTDEINKIPIAVKIARKTHKIVWQNIVLILGIKIIVMLLSIIGMANMSMAIFADVGVSLTAVFNSLRILMYKE